MDKMDSFKSIFPSLDRYNYHGSIELQADRKQSRGSNLHAGKPIRSFYARPTDWNMRCHTVAPEAYIGHL